MKDRVLVKGKTSETRVRRAEKVFLRRHGMASKVINIVKVHPTVWEAELEEVNACPKCGKEYKTEKGLKNHLKTCKKKKR